MGIVLEKVKSFIKSFGGTDNKTGEKRTFDNILSIMSLRGCRLGCSIRGVLYKVLPEEEVGDKFVASQQQNTQPASVKEQKIQTSEQTNVQTETQIQEKTDAPASTSAVSTNKNNNSKRNTSTTTNPVTDEELNKLKVELVAKCQENDINFAKLMVNISALTGKTLLEFNRMDKNTQKIILSYVSESIDRMKTSNLFNIDIDEAVIMDVALLYEFMTSDRKGNVRAIDNISPEELRKSRLAFEAKIKERKEQRLADIEKLPESEKAAAMDALKEEFAGYRKHIVEELRKQISFESAIEYLLIVSSKDLGVAAKELMESYPIEIREKIANTMQSFESFKEYINTAKGRGEDVGDEKALEAFEQYHKIFGTYKTKENLDKYEEQFQEARKNGELTEEISRASAMGIGEAAYANINMTSDEKETFISKWVTNNDGLLSDADLAKVETTASKYIEELLEKNPKVKDNFSKVKSSIKEIVEKTLNRVFEEKKSQNKEVSAKDVNKKLQRIINAPSGKVHRVHKEVLSQAQQYIRLQAAKFETPAIKKSTEQIELALVKGIINEEQALKNLDNSEHKFVKMCVQNSTLASKYDERINLYIKSEKDDERLRAIAAVAPHDIVIKIIHNMTGNKQKLADELIEKHEVDFNTKVLLKSYTAEEAA